MQPKRKEKEKREQQMLGKRDVLGMILGMFLQMIGSRKTVPPRMLRIVPLGDFHICFRLYSAWASEGGRK
jgi:hypothetical protein